MRARAERVLSFREPYPVEWSHTYADGLARDVLVLLDLLAGAKVYADEAELDGEWLEGAVANLSYTLGRIVENAEAWHGPPPDDSGHVRALAVIAGWGRAELAALTRPDDLNWRVDLLAGANGCVDEIDEERAKILKDALDKVLSDPLSRRILENSFRNM